MKSKKARSASRPAIRLAHGVHLDGGKETKEVFVLVCPDGKVQLNRLAAAVLRLCDGSHSRAELIAEVVRRSNEQARAIEITAFLDAARARGWIDES
jgi:pyrroloquinoline quinone biosynthesis protein D